MTGDKTFDRWFLEGLVWLPEAGMGYFPVDELPYDQAYFEKYVGYAATEKGRRITAARVDLVERYLDITRFDISLVDVGIGCGAFLEAWMERRPRWKVGGWDVNPAGMFWLEARGLLADPYCKPVANVCFWDVIEHVVDASLILENVTGHVFATLPIFEGPEHILRSRHFRKDEHCWYFTRAGFIRWMGAKGFDCLEHNTMESLLEREDAHTFVFRRRG